MGAEIPALEIPEIELKGANPWNQVFGPSTSPSETAPPYRIEHSFSLLLQVCVSMYVDGIIFKPLTRNGPHG